MFKLWFANLTTMEAIVAAVSRRGNTSVEALIQVARWLQMTDPFWEEKVDDYLEMKATLAENVTTMTVVSQHLVWLHFEVEKQRLETGLQDPWNTENDDDQREYRCSQMDAALAVYWDLKDLRDAVCGACWDLEDLTRRNELRVMSWCQQNEHLVPILSWM